MNRIPDRTRMSQLVASDMRYFGSKYGFAVLSLSTLLVCLISMLFSVFFYFTTESRTNFAYTLLSVLAMAAFVVAFVGYKLRIAADGFLYRTVMWYSMVFVLICTVAGFAFARTAWMWKLTDVSMGDYNRYLSAVFSWGFLPAILLLAADLLLVYVLPDLEIPYLGWTFNVYMLLPVSIVAAIMLITKFAAAENYFAAAKVCSVIYVALMLMLAAHFFSRWLMHRYLDTTASRYETFLKVRPAAAVPQVTAEEVAALREKLADRNEGAIEQTMESVETEIEHDPQLAETEALEKIALENEEESAAAGGDTAAAPQTAEPAESARAQQELSASAEQPADGAPSESAVPPCPEAAEERPEADEAVSGEAIAQAEEAAPADAARPATGEENPANEAETPTAALAAGNPAPLRHVSVVHHVKLVPTERPAAARKSFFEQCRQRAAEFADSLRMPQEADAAAQRGKATVPAAKPAAPQQKAQEAAPSAFAALLQDLRDALAALTKELRQKAAGLRRPAVSAAAAPAAASVPESPANPAPQTPAQEADAQTPSAAAAQTAPPAQADTAQTPSAAAAQIVSPAQDSAAETPEFDLAVGEIIGTGISENPAVPAAVRRAQMAPAPDSAAELRSLKAKLASLLLPGEHTAREHSDVYKKSVPADEPVMAAETNAASAAAQTGSAAAEPAPQQTIQAALPQQGTPADAPQADAATRQSETCASAPQQAEAAVAPFGPDSCCDAADEPDVGLRKAGQDWFAEVGDQLDRFSQAAARPTQEAPAQGEPVQSESLQDEPVRKEPVQDEPTQGESAQDEPAQGEPAQGESAQEDEPQDIVELLEEPQETPAPLLPQTAPEEPLTEVLEDIELLPPDAPAATATRPSKAKTQKTPAPERSDAGPAPKTAKKTTAGQTAAANSKKAPAAAKKSGKAGNAKTPGKTGKAPQGGKTGGGKKTAPAGKNGTKKK